MLLFILRLVALTFFFTKSDLVAVCEDGIFLCLPLVCHYVMAPNPPRLLIGLGTYKLFALKVFDSIGAILATFFVPAATLDD